MAVAAPVMIALAARASLGALGQLAFRALVQHGDDGADDLEVAELLGGDVEQHVLAAGVALRKACVK